jgi:hypothetical protein
VSERPKEHASKACVGETQPWVQIPPPPPAEIRYLECWETMSITNWYLVRTKMVAVPLSTSCQLHVQNTCAFHKSNLEIPCQD